MRKLLSGFALLSVLLALATLSGCVAAFTSTGQLQIGKASVAGETEAILADFEASEDSGVAGDITKKSGSSCAGGVCTIY